MACVTIAVHRGAGHAARHRLCPPRSPGDRLALWAAGEDLVAWRAACRIPSSSGLTGAEAAEQVLLAGGLGRGDRARGRPARGPLRHGSQGLAALASGLRRPVPRGGRDRGPRGRPCDPGGALGIPGSWSATPSCRSPVWSRRPSGISFLAGLFLGMFRLILAALYLLEFSALLLQLINLPGRVRCQPPRSPTPPLEQCDRPRGGPTTRPRHGCRSVGPRRGTLTGLMTGCTTWSIRGWGGGAQATSERRFSRRRNLPNRHPIVYMGAIAWACLSEPGRARVKLDGLRGS